MSTAQFTCPLIVVIPGQVIAASLWNNEFTNLFTNINPLGVGSYSDTDPQMQTQTDPFPSGSTSRPTSVAGELERIRFVVAGITGNALWYQVPDATIAELAQDVVDVNARFPIQTVDIGDAQVTTAKIALQAITNSRIADGNVGTTQLTDAGVTEGKLAASVAGNGLSGGAGTPLAVNVDGSTIAISGDTLAVPSGGITPTQLSAGVPVAVGLKSIQTLSFLATIGSGQTTATINTTISSINTAKAVAVVKTFSISSLSATNHQTPMVSLALTSATNLQTSLQIFTGLAGGADAFNMVITILEFN